MRGPLRLVSAFALIAVSTAFLAQPGSAGSRPRWVLHVEHFPGGISGGPRARLEAAGGGAAGGGAAGRRARLASPRLSTGDPANLQANTDCTPPLPQDETSVAFNVFDPMNAVAAANDFCGDGYWIGHTTDGGQTWTSEFKDPKTSTGDRCFGSDPSVVFSRRDSAFYVSTLCFFTTSPISEVQVWKSVDGGATWTASTDASIVITNRAADGSIDGSVFFDKELMAVDNNPGSPHFGRLYVTFIKFHMLPASGRSDFCPVQLAFTDDIPTADPATASWSHVAVVPDDPGSRGVGPFANQWALPVVDDEGGLDVSFASEDCNTGFDRGLFFTRSTDGGGTFGGIVRIDKPGQFADNPNFQDLLPAKHARLPISPSMAFDPTRGTLLYVYQNNLHRGASGADISLQTSDDFGQTWSDAATISVTGSGAPAPKDQFFPWIAVDESGNYHAIWFDNRNDPGNKLIETFQAASTDGGGTWTNANISTAAWNPDKSFFTCGCFIGDYNAIAASDHVIYPVWTDGRNSSGQPLGQTDIFTNVEISPSTGRSEGVLRTAPAAVRGRRPPASGTLATSGASAVVPAREGAMGDTMRQWLGGRSRHGFVVAIVLSLLVVPAAPGFAASLFADGFESGNLSAWNTVVGGFTAQQDAPFAGSWYGRAVSAGASTYARKTLATTQADLYVQSAVRVASAPGGVVLMRLTTAGGSSLVSLKIDKTAKLSIKNHVSGATVKSATALPIGAWHLLQLHALVNGPSSLAEVWLDGVQLTDLTSSASLGTIPVGALLIGNKGSSSGFTVGFDEVVIDTTFIGGGPPTAPDTPANLHTTSVTASRVSLAWDPVAGANGYGVYRDGTLLQEVTTNAFDDLTVQPLTQYSYTVDAFAGSLRSNQSAPVVVDTPAQVPGGETVLMGAGDIACDPADVNFNGGLGTANRCRQMHTAALLAGADAVFAVGDTQYFCGGTAAYQQSYDPSWGQFKAITYAAVADAEYATTGGTDCSTGAAGFYGYFGARGGAGSDGLYSFDLPEGCTPGAAGCWHVVVLNSVCSAVGGCGHGEPMDTFLQQDLAASSAAQCTIGMLHIPRFASKASGKNVINDNVLALWESMYAGGVDIVLSGNSHFYERFAPQDPLGNAVPNGIAEFIVGTGGRGLGGIADPALRLANSQAGTSDDFGVLKLVLHDGSYDFQFLPEGTSTFTDGGTTSCTF